MKIRPVGPQIGVGVSGVDVRTLDDAAFATIYRAWLGHGILVVTGQELTIPEFPRYSHQFGMVEPAPVKEHPLVWPALPYGHVELDHSILEVLRTRAVQNEVR